MTDSLLHHPAGSAGKGDPALEETIAVNVRALRSQAGLSVAEMADRIGISKGMLSKIENAQTSCSLGTLARLGVGLDVPVTSLLRGADTVREAVHTRAGQGPAVTRVGTHAGIDYELLGALHGQHKRLESLMVTLTATSDTGPLVQHPGTEFLHLLEGVMDFEHSQSVYRLSPGDSLQFDGEGAHGPVELVQLPLRFLCVIAFPDNARR